MTSTALFQTAFVTGSTGLLGNNLVRALVAQGYQVKALARCAEKAQQQFVNLPQVQVVLGDMLAVDGFEPELRGCDVVFHTAAFFRDSYKGGKHQTALTQTNVQASAQLLQAAYRQGIRRFVHTSSIAVLSGDAGSVIDETCDRVLPAQAKDLDDYYRSKVLSDQAVRDFIKAHPDMRVTFVLPGWMWGPGDRGPTAAGQFLLSVVQRKLPVCMHGSFSVVDARDVAQAHIAAALKQADGVNGDRYLAAGRYITMFDLVQLIGRSVRVKVPQTIIPTVLAYVFATLSEVYGALTQKPVLMSWAAVKLMQQENGRTHFSSDKAMRELGVTFRPFEQTVHDTWVWYHENGWI